MIKQSEVVREDNLFIALEGITEEEGRFVQTELGEVHDRLHFASATHNTRLQIYYTVDLDVILIDRTVYSTFMLLGDVGGFSGLLFTIGSSLVSVLTYNNPENRLIEKLY